MRSQLLASVNSPRTLHPHPETAEESAEHPSRARIRELEQEVARLKVDNAKQKEQIDKYKDKVRPMSNFRYPADASLHNSKLPQKPSARPNQAYRRALKEAQSKRSTPIMTGHEGHHQLY